MKKKEASVVDRVRNTFNARSGGVHQPKVRKTGTADPASKVNAMAGNRAGTSNVKATTGKFATTRK